MVNFVFTVAAFDLFNGDLDFNAPNDIRVMLLEKKTDVNKDDLTVAVVLLRAGTTELSSTNYVRQALANETTVQDDANDRVEFDADDATFSSLVQSSTEAIVAYLVFKDGGADSSSVPILQVDISPSITPNGTLTLQWDAEGILQGASA